MLSISITQLNVNGRLSMSNYKDTGTYNRQCCRPELYNDITAYFLIGFLCSKICWVFLNSFFIYLLNDIYFDLFI